MEITVDELENDLRRYLKEVRAGVPIAVTDDGEAILRIIRVPSAAHAPSSLRQAIAAGVVTPPQRPKGPARIPLKAAGIVSDLIRDSR